MSNGHSESSPNPANHHIPFSTLCSRYEEEIKDLSQRASNITAAALLRVLRTREKIAQTLDRSAVSPEYITQLANADEQLKAMAKSGALDPIFRQVKLWRSSLVCADSEWWWALDEIAQEDAEARSWVPLGLTALLFTISLSFVTEIVTRFFKEGADVWGALNITLQAVLTLAAAGSFTEVGKKTLDHLFPADRSGRLRRSIVQVGIGVISLLLSIVIYFMLPWFARLYNNAGQAEHDRWNLPRAEDSFRRAIYLRPDYPTAHYNLGLLYEDLAQPEKAVAEYKTAISVTPDLSPDSKRLNYRARNNLARLLLLDGKSNPSALALLDDLISRLNAPGVKPDIDVLYAAYKNRGWANFSLHYTDSAEADLRRALDIRNDGASAHCLLALSLEARVPQDSAVHAEEAQHWENCIAYRSYDSSVEATWIAEARKRIQPR